MNFPAFDYYEMVFGKWIILVFYKIRAMSPFDIMEFKFMVICQAAMAYLAGIPYAFYRTFGAFQENALVERPLSHFMIILE
jgi:hypothetical protein